MPVCRPTGGACANAQASSASAFMTIDMTSRLSSCARPATCGSCRKASGTPASRRPPAIPMSSTVKWRKRWGASAGPHAPLRAEREREFRGVVAVGGIDDDQEIAVAGRKVDLLDLNSHLLGQILSGFGALGSILDRPDSLLGPAQRTHERRHAILRVIARKDCRPLQKRPSIRGL